MTTVKIDIPDEQAAALRAKAAAQGLTLEDWFQKMAAQDEQSGTDIYRQGKRTVTPHLEKNVKCDSEHYRGSVVERMRELRARVKPDPEGWTVRDYINYGRR